MIYVDKQTHRQTICLCVIVSVYLFFCLSLRLSVLAWLIYSIFGVVACVASVGWFTCLSDSLSV